MHWHLSHTELKRALNCMHCHRYSDNNRAASTPTDRITGTMIDVKSHLRPLKYVLNIQKSLTLHTLWRSQSQD